MSGGVKMQCEKCGAETGLEMVSCPECGAPVPQNVEGFDNTMEFQSELREIVVENGPWAVADIDKFIGLLGDHVPDHFKERRLLVNMYRSGVLKILLEESRKDNRELAIMKARSFLVGDMFLAENAAEFVISCFTYMLGWPYASPLKKTPGTCQTPLASFSEK